MSWACMNRTSFRPCGTDAVLRGQQPTTATSRRRPWHAARRRLRSCLYPGLRARRCDALLGDEHASQRRGDAAGAHCSMSMSL